MKKQPVPVNNGSHGEGVRQRWMVEAGDTADSSLVHIGGVGPGLIDVGLFDAINEKMASQLQEYIAAAKREPSRENLREMWKRVFMLKGWYFLPAEDREGPNRPAVLQYEDGAWLPICTDVRRLRRLAEKMGRVDDEGEMNILVLDPSESMERIREVGEALAGVVFNPSTDVSVRAPVEALEEFADEFNVQ